MSRPYTGTKEGIGRGRRRGTELFASKTQLDSAGRLWNNGTYAMRTMRGSNAVSVHATGRAVDISHRKTAKHQGADRALVLRWIDTLIKYQDELGLEMIVDYAYTGGLGGGRVWKCDRNAWKDAKRGTIQGGGNPASDWIHVELSPTAADSAEMVASALTLIMAQLSTPTAPPAPTPDEEKPRYPGRPLKQGSKGKSVEHIQRRLGIKVDGDFGPATDRHVRAFQTANGLVVDGIVGISTWTKLFAPSR
jgi:hypothetical protein